MRRVVLDGVVYPRECIAAAARALSARAEVEIPRAWGSRAVLTLRSLDGTPPARLEVELLDEALSCLYRRAVSAFHEEASRPALATAAERGFRPRADDYLERMEPDVARDHRLEAEALLAEAGEMQDACG